MTWSKEDFEFISHLNHVDRVQMLEVISDIIKQHFDMTRKFQEKQFSGFFLPISQGYLVATFGSGVMQIPSGKSVVIT